MKRSLKRLAIGAGLSTALVGVAMACPGMNCPFAHAHATRVVTFIPEGVHGSLVFKPRHEHMGKHDKLNLAQGRIMAQAALIRRGHLNYQVGNGHLAKKVPNHFVFTVSTKKNQVLGKVSVDAWNGMVRPIIHRPGEWF